MPTATLTPDLIVRVLDIRVACARSNYDHRPFLPTGVGEPWTRDDFRQGYACFKREVARILAPKSILEIGVGIGVSALAFLNGCPFATYAGVDSDAEAMRDFPIQPSAYVRALLSAQGHPSEILVADTQKLALLPFAADFVHVDGDHHRAACAHDVRLAWNVLPPDSGYILVDDARDSAVAAGVFDALAELRPGSCEWAYFEDTWTGNILISKETPRP